MADDANSTFVPDTSNVVTHPREQMRLLREKLAEAAQHLIDAMDAIDGDPDLEPSLGSLGASVSNPWATTPKWAGGGTDDREDEHDGREPGEDDEPSLGSPNQSLYASQERWAPRMREMNDEYGGVDLESDFSQTAGGVNEDQEFSWRQIADAGDVLDTHEGEDSEDREPEEADSWYVNPHSINQTGDLWSTGEAPAGERHGPRYVPPVQPIEPDTVIIPHLSVHGTFVRDGVPLVGSPDRK